MKKIIVMTTLVLSTFSVASFAASENSGENQITPNNTMMYPHMKAHKMLMNNMHHHGGNRGGFSDVNQETNKISDADNWTDDQRIILQGKIVKRVGKDDYIISDASGQMEVEIEGRAWRGVNVTPNDTVRFYGEVDKSWNKIEVEIDRIEKVQ
ncbi:YgiW/YdeI family stress tolerance OB fold protein [Otariodibacter oris]|uniref:Uncharacterized protein (TIGR00156 family) n=1 Tax=Otariodibacter oris TaxID=1032623 RepID=A0A420XFT2_9PAST|nr:NirD/YgiW/YdeI family stress tolerance protein [Otariodibacter oris]QGM81599.1 hypothetical protein A6A10_09395 [Otariodibacter oris]RKR71211.1 uncharacterized protein (TIGR00156 family) [Otariodibacter oris]